MSGCLTRRTRLLCPKEETPPRTRQAGAMTVGAAGVPTATRLPAPPTPNAAAGPLSPRAGTSREPSTAAESLPNRVQRKSTAAVRSA